jgi:hypothetical protein
MKITQTEKSLIQLLNMVVHLNGKVSALESACGILWEKSGLAPKDLSKFIEEQAAQTTERWLLNVGDTHPDLAEFADVLKTLNKARGE